jgi:Icc protein
MKIIAQVSDIHLGERVDVIPAVDPKVNLVSVLEDIKARGIEEIILTGDICSKDTADELKSMLEAYGLKYSFVLGNHDEMEAVGFYSFITEGRTCLVLDSSRGTIDSTQLGWLEKELQQAESSDIVIFIHHPILDCGSLMDKLYPLLNREDVEALINNSGKTAYVFCGHYHSEDFRIKGSIRQYVTPSAFYQLKPYGERLEIDDIPIGYRIITFDEEIESLVIRI